MIKNINQASVQAQQVRNYNAETIGKKDHDKKVKDNKQETVIYSHDDPKDLTPSAYNSKGRKIDDSSQAIEDMKREAEQKYQALRDLVREMIIQQGKNPDDILGKLEAGEEVSVEITPQVRAEAQANISEGGYWSVEATSGRILDFARALADRDPSKLGMLKNAFKEGYAAAKQAFGGQLPEISQRTHDAVMKGFDDLEKELSQ